MPSQFQIGDRKIGIDESPLVIVEIGINHEGQLDKAIELVDAAHSVGAELVKFQCHITEDEMIPTDIKPEGISEEMLWNIIEQFRSPHLWKQGKNEWILRHPIA